MDAADNKAPERTPKFKLMRGKEFRDWLAADPKREQSFIEGMTKLANGEFWAENTDLHEQARYRLKVHLKLRACQRKMQEANRKLSEADQAARAHQNMVEKKKAVVEVLSAPGAGLAPVERLAQARSYFNEITAALREIPEAEWVEDVKQILPDWENMRAILFFEDGKPS